MPTEASLSSSYIKTASQKFTPYGAEHVEVYNLERKTDDIKRLLEEKQRAGQEPRGEVDEGQQGEPRPQFSPINPQGL